MEHKEYLLKSFDETMINVHVAGEGDTVIIVSNGLGGNFYIFEEIIKELPSIKFISWDYRGLYKSHVPKNRNDVTIEHHIRDLEEILKHEKVDKAVFLGWSMGATINLQFHKKNPSFFKAMIMLNPVNKSTIKNMLSVMRFTKLFLKEKINIPYLGNLPSVINSIPDEITEKYTYKILVLLQEYHFIYSKLLKTISKIPRIATYLKKLKILSSNMDDYFFEDIFKEYAELDMEIYIEIVKDLFNYDHDEEIYSKLNIPTLLFYSTRDIFVPVEYIEKIKSLNPKIETIEIFRASHYGLIEFPEMVALGIRRFLRNNKIKVIL